MTVGRSARRAERSARIATVFGEQAASAVLDLLELTELAWHDSYGEITPPEGVIDDILTCSRGDLGELVRAARLAVEDWRDLALRAEAIRLGTTKARGHLG